jgi:plasmid stabilization system protein ParE
MYTVAITDQAEEDLDRIVEFIGLNWPAKIKTDFLASLSDKLQLLETNPFIYRASKKEPDVRECTVNRFIVMYYRVSESLQSVEVLSFKDNRSNS